LHHCKEISQFHELFQIDRHDDDQGVENRAQVFWEAAGPRAGSGTVIAQLLLQQDGQGPAKEAPLLIELLTHSEVEHYLSHRVLQDRRTALLQAFVPPAGDHNMMIRATYTAHLDVQIQVRCCRQWPASFHSVGIAVQGLASGVSFFRESVC
jgi:hypothetical protein